VYEKCLVFWLLVVNIHNAGQPDDGNSLIQTSANLCRCTLKTLGYFQKNYCFLGGQVPHSQSSLAFLTQPLAIFYDEINEILFSNVIVFAFGSQP
jgi:hypothetical protein